MPLDKKETNNPEIDWDSLFEEFMRYETNIQKPLREQIHKDIENTLIENR